MKKKCVIAGIWLVLWYGLDRFIGNDILFAGPARTAAALVRMAGTGEFWQSVAGSLLRILGGCLTGGLLGILMAAASSRFHLLKEFLAPLVAVIKALPVVSFVILVLIWAGNRRLSFVICAVITFPVLYLQTLAGIGSADRKLLEMAAVFRMPLRFRLSRIYWPALRPQLLGAVSVALGMGFKGGVSAEVIGQPLHTIGNSLYRAKIVLATDEVFAWSLVTILLSVLFGAGLERLIRRLEKQ